jgi:PEP-CTERM motif
LSYRVGYTGRGRYGRRKRLQLGVALVFVLTLAAAGGLAVWWATPHHRTVLRYAASLGTVDPEWIRGNTSQNLAILAGHTGVQPETRTGRLVYPYSVIPGGVRDAQELHEAIQHDRAVASHYAGFDYVRARTFALREPRVVYLSYRIGDKIFWTRRQFTLRRGEILLTDGKITARTRCANRVSAVPEPLVSSEEPLPEQLEDPFQEGGSARPMAFPGNFESALLARNGESGFGMLGPPPTGTSGFGISNGNVPGIFPPPIPGTCATTMKPFPKDGVMELPEGIDKSNKKSGCAPSSTPSPPPPTPVPEPSTVLLFASGAVGICMRYRKFRAKR